MSKYLTEIYQAMGQALSVENAYFESDSRFYTLERELLALPPGRVLDLGCGQGALLARVKSRHEVYGLEWDEGAAGVARSRGLSIDKIDLNDASSLPFDGLFDAIVCSEVCEHLLDPRNVFTLAFEKLAPHGVFVVTVPNAVPLFARLSLLLGRTCPWLHYPSGDTERTGHVRFYTLESLTALGAQCGFSVVRRQGLSWRMNGRFWEKLFYWLSRLRRAPNISKSAMLFDCAFGLAFPSLSPGLMLVLRKRNSGGDSGKK